MSIFNFSPSLPCDGIFVRAHALLFAPTHCCSPAHSRAAPCVIVCASYAVMVEGAFVLMGLMLMMRVVVIVVVVVVVIVVAVVLVGNSSSSRSSSSSSR